MRKTGIAKQYTTLGFAAEKPFRWESAVSLPETCGQRFPIFLVNQALGRKDLLPTRRTIAAASEKTS
jgi:hypothetical protein